MQMDAGEEVFEIEDSVVDEFTERRWKEAVEEAMAMDMGKV